MSSNLKRYLQEVSVEEHVEVDDDYILEISAESIEKHFAEIDQAMNLAVALESLSEELVSQEHTDVSLEHFGEKLSLAFQVAGMEMPVEHMVPSLEESKELTTTGGGDKEAGGGKFAKVKETIAKIIAWIREKIKQLTDALSKSGAVITAQVAKTKEAAVKLKDEAAAKVSKISSKIRTPKTKASVLEFKAALDECHKASISSQAVSDKYMANKKPLDDEYKKVVDKVDEANKKLLSLKIDLSEGVDKESLTVAKSVIEFVTSVFDTPIMKKVIKGDATKNTIKMMESQLKTLQNKGNPDEEDEVVIKAIQESIGFLNQLDSKARAVVNDSIKVNRYALNQMNRVVKAAGKSKDDDSSDE